MFRHAGGQRALAGVAEGRVAQIMRERDGLGEVFVEREGTGEGAGDLPHLDRVRQAGSKVIPVEGHEDLAFVGEPAEGGRMEHPVAVALKFAASS